MAESDFNVLSGSLPAGVLRRGATSSIATPPGGDGYSFGWAMAQAGQSGAHGLIYRRANFNPTASMTGGRVQGAVLRNVSPQASGFSVFLMIGAQGESVADQAYMVGIQDSDPGRIALCKGPINAGIPAGAVGENGLMAISIDSIPLGEWVHLQCEMIVNGTGDVALRVRRNNGPVSSPTWEAIPGIDLVIDDVLGATTGTLPFTTSRFGFGFASSQVSTRGAVEYFQCARQL